MATKQKTAVAAEPIASGTAVVDNGDGTVSRAATITGDGSGTALPPADSAAKIDDTTPAADAKRLIHQAQEHVEIDALLASAESYLPIYKDNNGTEVTAAQGDNLGHHYEVFNQGLMKVEALLRIEFQNGPVKEVGVNGVQNEHLLAVLIHRTTILNERFPCDENMLAIRHMKLATNALQARTANRQARGVEGENKL